MLVTVITLDHFLCSVQHQVTGPSDSDGNINEHTVKLTQFQCAHFLVC